MPWKGLIRRYALLLLALVFISSCSPKEPLDEAESKPNPNDSSNKTITQQEKQILSQDDQPKEQAKELLHEQNSGLSGPEPKIEANVDTEKMQTVQQPHEGQPANEQQPANTPKRPIDRSSESSKAPKHSDKPSKKGKPKPVYYSAKTSRKVVALTFDDGPDDLYTPQVLDVLNKHNVKATFFLMGKRAHEHPGIVKRILREGHVIGNHTWGHPNLNKLSEAEIKNELEKTQAELRAITGIHSALFRPPYGNASSSTVDLIDTLGMRTIRWSVDTRDWEGKSVSEMMSTVKKQLKPGGIILQHSAGGEGQDMTNTVNLLKQLIPSLRKEGYTFVTVPSLLDIPAYAE
jgi:peptidoglycan-N-acetylglucosamine deacetylase